MTRVTNLKDMQNLPFVPEARLPHACLLSKWLDNGLVDIDADASRFVLTSEGREQADMAEAEVAA
jgi:hypothetical protein